MASKRILTDYSEMVTVGEDDHGDIRLSLYRVLPGEPSTRTDEVVLRPSQAERLAAELLAYANGDHLLPINAVRPVRIVQSSETPDDSDFTRGYRQANADHAFDGGYVCDECGECGDGHTLDCPWGKKFPPGTSVSELEVRQNELYLAMRAVEEMPPSAAQTACIVKLGERMQLLVKLLGKSEVGRYLDV